MAGWRERFEDKVDRSGDCHVWTGAKTPSGVSQVRIGGKLRTAAQVAWEIEHGPLVHGSRIRSCDVTPLCVRVDHLDVEEPSPVAVERSRRAPRGSGSMREVADGKWKLTVDAGRDARGRRRRVTRTVHGSQRDASRALAALTTDVQSGKRKPSAPTTSGKAALSVTGLMEWYVPFAREVRGLERGTVHGYAEVFDVWLKDQIGHLAADRLTPGDVDVAFGKMRAGGLSQSRMGHARSALSGAYKWGRRHDKVTANPMAGFELPKSKKVKKKTVAPELGDLLALLEHARSEDPEFSPVLTLAATTGMRRGELSGLRRCHLRLDRQEIHVQRSISEIEGELEDKPTKTHDTRTVRLDEATTAFLVEHLSAMDERASELGFSVGDDGFVFSLEPDCHAPMRPELMTRRMRRLRKSLGAGSLSFDATILAMRKWTSTELLDAGFNPSTVSGRQGHTVQVMLNNYSAHRASADQAAADHLGDIVHGQPSAGDGS